jgi:hypothetical protein
MGKCPVSTPRMPSTGTISETARRQPQTDALRHGNGTKAVDRHIAHGVDGRFGSWSKRDNLWLFHLFPMGQWSGSSPDDPFGWVQPVGTYSGVLCRHRGSHIWIHNNEIAQNKAENIWSQGNISFNSSESSTRICGETIGVLNPGWRNPPACFIYRPPVSRSALEKQTQQQAFPPLSSLLVLVYSSQVRHRLDYSGLSTSTSCIDA